MSVKKFFVYSALGLVIWNTTLMAIGYYALNDYTIVEKYMKPFADGIIYLFIGVYVVQVIRFVLDKEARK